MAVEIERKFLVTSPAWQASVLSSRSFVQAYLAVEGPASVRIRIVDDMSARLTVKGEPAGIARLEFEYEIPAEDARLMLDLRIGSLIRKTRHLVPMGSLTWEIDVFESDHKGLVIAEIELPTPDADFPRPAWLGREVTGDERYYNATLALTAGLPAQI